MARTRYFILGACLGIGVFLYLNKELNNPTTERISAPLNIESPVPSESKTPAIPESIQSTASVDAASSPSESSIAPPPLDKDTQKNVTPLSKSQLRPIKKHIPSYEEIFAQTFGTSLSTSYLNIRVPILIDDTPHATIQSWIPSLGDNIQLSAGELLSLINTYIDDNTRLILSESISENGRLSKQDLEANAFKVNYDAQAQYVYIYTPNYDSSKHSRENSETNTVQNIPPSDISGYVNLRANQSFNSSTNKSPDIRYEFVLNTYDWVWKSLAETGASNDGLAFTKAQVLRDFHNTDSRLIVGDLDYPVAGVQNKSALFGLGLTKGYLLPDRLIQANIDQYTLTLPNDAYIEIRANDSLIHSENLSAGEYDVRDFPINKELNIVHIKTIDVHGEIRDFSYSLIQNQRLMAHKDSEFSYNIGYPVEHDSSNGNFNFDSKAEALVFHRLGLKANWTHTLYAQGNDEEQVLGTNQVFGTNSGLLQLDLASSIGQQKNTGYQVDLNFSSYASHAKENLLQHWGFGLNASTGAFKTYGSDSSDGDINSYLYQNLRLGPSLTQSIRVRGSIIAPENHSVFSSLNYHLNDAWLFNVSLTKENNNDTGETWTSRFGITWSDHIMRLRGQYSPENNSSSLSSTYKANDSLALYNTFSRVKNDYSINNQFKYELDDKDLLLGYYKVDKDESGNSHDISLSYKGGRGNLGASIDESGTGSIFLDTAIAFTPGHIGISRPILSSFAIMDINSKLNGTDFKFAPSGKSGLLGNPVVTPLSSYRQNKIELLQANVPPTTHLGSGVYYVYPHEHSGYVIPVGSSQPSSVSGVLFDFYENPVSRSLGYFHKVDSNDKFVFFTNSKGKFLLTNIPEGKYIVQLYNDNTYQAKVQINSKGPSFLKIQLE